MHELFNLSTKKTIMLPEEVSELTPDQYLYYLDLVLENMVGTITDPQEIKRKLFVKFTDLKMSWKLQFRPVDVQEAVWSALQAKIDLLDSFFEIDENAEGKSIYSLQIKCATNLLPVWQNYRGPENLLMDITWATFKQCLNALKMLNKAHETRNLVEIEKYTRDIFTALYVPQKSGQRKIAFPDTVLFHALTYFSYWYELITNYPIEINGEPIDFSILWKTDENEDENEEDKKERLDKSGWLGISFDIAESGVFGDATDVDNTKLYKVLMLLYKNKCKEIEDRKQLNKQKNDTTY